MAVRTAWTPIAVSGELVEQADIRSIGGGAIGYATVTANQNVATSTVTDLTGLAVTVTVGASRLIRLSASCLLSRSVADGVTVGYFREGTTELGRWGQHSPSAATEFDWCAGWCLVVAPTEGTHTYKLSMNRATGTGNSTLNAAAGAAAWFLVEDIGPSF